jgi:hypothetical protein
MRVVYAQKSPASTHNWNAELIQAGAGSADILSAAGRGTFCHPSFASDSPDRMSVIQQRAECTRSGIPNHQRHWD